MSDNPIHCRTVLTACLALCLLTVSTLAQPVDAVAESDAANAADALNKQATQIVLRSARSDDPFLRANAMEAAEHLGMRAVPLLQVGVEDDSRAVRFAALCTIGKLQETSMEAVARRKLTDPDLSVRCAAVFALQQMKKQVDMAPLAQAVMGTDMTHRNNAALLLGLIGEPSAVPMLASAARKKLPRVAPLMEAIGRIQLAEAMVVLGSDDALDAIRAGMYSTFDEVRVLSALTVGRVDDRTMAPALRRLLGQNPVELRLAAAASLARMGNAQSCSDALPVVLKATDFPNPAVRSQAALTLAEFDGPAARAAQAQMMTQDTDPAVRLAAAAGVLRR